MAVSQLIFLNTKARHSQHSANLVASGPAGIVAKFSSFEIIINNFRLCTFLECKQQLPSSWILGGGKCLGSICYHC